MIRKTQNLDYDQMSMEDSQGPAELLPIMEAQV